MIRHRGCVHAVPRPFRSLRLCIIKREAVGRTTLKWALDFRANLLQLEPHGPADAVVLEAAQHVLLRAWKLIDVLKDGKRGDIEAVSHSNHSNDKLESLSCTSEEE